MLESTLTRQLLADIHCELFTRSSRAVFELIKLADRARSGLPDFMFCWSGMTSFWEVKLADPDFESPGIQELTCTRLHVAAQSCHYIIFDTADYQTTIFPALIRNVRATFRDKESTERVTVPRKARLIFDIEAVAREVIRIHARGR